VKRTKGLKQYNLNTMKEGLEIERTFLLKQIPNCNDYPKLEMLQHYVHIGDDRFRVRATYQEGKETYYDKTYKKFLSEGVYDEKIIDLTKKEFHELSKHSHKSIAKQRIVVPTVYGLKWEIDVFDYPLTLVLAEIEIPHIGYEIIMPDFIKDALLMEVTHLRQFTNYALAIPVNQETPS